MSSVLIGIGAIAGSLSVAGGAAALRPSTTLVQVRSNLAAGLDNPVAAVRPGVPAVAERIARLFTPAGVVRRLEHRYSLAGRPDGWAVPRLLILKPVLA